MASDQLRSRNSLSSASQRFLFLAALLASCLDGRGYIVVEEEGEGSDLPELPDPHGPDSHPEHGDGDSDGDSDSGSDADAESDADADTDSDPGSGTGSDADADTDTDADGDADPGDHHHSATMTGSPARAVWPFSSRPVPRSARE